MKLGTENRKQVIALAVLGGLALVSLAYQFWPSGDTVTASPTPVATTTTAHPATRRTASGKIVPIVEPRLDPTLDLKLLTQSEEIKYAGNGRNIFVAGSVPTIETPLKSGARDHDKKTAVYIPPAPPPPPPINLRFFGFASKPGEPKKVFLSQGEDVFIAAEGEIVNRRYKVVRISPVAVEIEDEMNNHKQSIPLTSG